MRKWSPECGTITRCCGLVLQDGLLISLTKRDMTHRYTADVTLRLPVKLY